MRLIQSIKNLISFIIIFHQNFVLYGIVLIVIQTPKEVAIYEINVYILNYVYKVMERDSCSGSRTGTQIKIEIASTIIILVLVLRNWNNTIAHCRLC